MNHGPIKGAIMLLLLFLVPPAPTPPNHSLHKNITSNLVWVGGSKMNEAHIILYETHETNTSLVCLFFPGLKS